MEERSVRCFHGKTDLQCKIIPYQTAENQAGGEGVQETMLCWMCVRTLLLITKEEMREKGKKQLFFTCRSYKFTKERPAFHQTQGNPLNACKTRKTFISISHYIPQNQLLQWKRHNF